MPVNSDRRLKVTTANLEAAPMLKKLYAMLLMDNPLVIKATIVARVSICFMKSLVRPMQRRNASEDMDVSHFYERIMLLLNLLAVALAEELSLKLAHETVPKPKVYRSHLSRQATCRS